MKKNIFYAQSGGATAVINASACGLIQAARKHSNQFGTVYAGRNGIIGALQEELIDTSLESEDAIAALKHTPSSAFGSCGRYRRRCPPLHPPLERRRARHWARIGRINLVDSPGASMAGICKLNLAFLLLQDVYFFKYFCHNL